jgi:membrane-associated progesterone receptor component
MLSNPLNALLVPPILYLVYLIIRPAAPKTPAVLPDKYSEDEYNWLPAKHPDVVCYQKFSPAELVRYDGKDGGRICLAIYRVDRSGKIAPGGKGERTVFDVSAGRNFYGPGEWSSCMSGVSSG